MLTQIRDCGQLAGKTVAKAHESLSRLFIVFADGTFYHVAAASDGGDEASLTGHFNDYECFDDLLALGIITPDEHAPFRERADNWAAAAERAQYERLKAKFEG